MFRAHGVDLRQGDDLRLGVELRAIGGEFAPHGLIIPPGVLAGRVDEMQQRPAALDVAEKAVAEPVALMGALDEAGNVGEHEFALVAAHDAEVGLERREGIVGDLWLGGGDAGDERRFADVRRADEGDKTAACFSARAVVHAAPFWPMPSRAMNAAAAACSARRFAKPLASACG